MVTYPNWDDPGAAFSAMSRCSTPRAMTTRVSWNEYHLCTLATVRPDGRPHVVPVGVTVDAGEDVARVNTRKGSKKVANIQAEKPDGARVAVCQVDGGRWATLDGTAVF